MHSLDEPGSEATPRRPGIFARDWQKALVILLTILAACALLWVIWQIVTPILRTVILFLLAGVLTFALAPPVSLLERRIRNRLVAIAVVSLLFGGLLIGGIVLLAGPFVSQATTLAGDLPRYMDELQRRTPEIEAMFEPYGLRVDLAEMQQRILSTIDQNGVSLLTQLVGSIGEVGGMLVDALLTVVISFYLLVDGPAIRRRVLSVVPADHQGKALFFEANASRVLGGYLRGQLIMAGLMGILAGIGVALLGLPYAVVLGVLAGLFALVPMFGPILAAVPAVLVALFQPFPTVIWVLILFVAISQIVTNVLGPRITGHAVGLHPLAAMFALLAGFQLAGFLGGLFAVPLAGILWVLITAAYRNAVVEPPPARRVLLPRLRRREVAAAAAAVEPPPYRADQEGTPSPPRRV
jgi:predicted PurR-regulated permease PerM